MATSTHASQMATGGLLLLALLPTVTPWIRTRRVSALSITITVATVLPFAVWYERGEGGVYLSPLVLLIYIMRFRTDLFIVKNTTNSCSISKVHLVVFFTINKSYKLEGLVEIGYIS